MNSDKKKIHNGFNKDFFNFKKNIKDIWNGEPSLVYSFWVIYAIYTSALQVIGLFWGEGQDNFSNFENLLFIFFVVFVYFLEKIVKKKVPPTGVEPVTFACRYTSATLYH